MVKNLMQITLDSSNSFASKLKKIRALLIIKTNYLINLHRS